MCEGKRGCRSAIASQYVPSAVDYACRAQAVASCGRNVKTGTGRVRLGGCRYKIAKQVSMGHPCSAQSSLRRVSFRVTAAVLANLNALGCFAARRSKAAE